MNQLREIAKQLADSIPSEPAENMKWRLELYERLGKSEDERKDFLALCAAYFPLTFKSLYFTFNPKAPVGFRNIPFVTWESQDDTIEKICDCITKGKPLVVDKSRDEGATWIMMGTFLCYMLFTNDCNFLVGSRKEEYVDKTGDHKTLFAKLMYLIDKLPIWCRPTIEKNHMHLKIIETNSVCDGEATNENFGAGDRRTAVGLDEFGRVDGNIAENIKDTISDVTDCVIYNSTHFYGINHPYNKVLTGGHCEIAVLDWESNPIKSRGMYSSPDLNVIKFHDVEYWKSLYPKLFVDIEACKEYKASDLERWGIELGYDPYRFIAVGDGSQRRSPWFDKQERERSPKDLAMNVKRDPIGSSGGFFDASVVNRAISECRKPDIEGEVIYGIRDNKILAINFVGRSGKNRLKWWGELPEGKPDQTHNYIIGCDISMGTGASHSSVSIYDTNTHEKCGKWVCAFTEPVTFAEQVVAILIWCGGADRPLLIFESNGGQGLIFDRRVAELGWTNTYYQTDERISYRPDKAKRGWHSSTSSKQDMLSIYRNALYCRYTTNTKDSFISYDEEALRQCLDYVYIGQKSIGPSMFREADDGAQSTHGDMVISDGLCCLARNDQGVGIVKEHQRIFKNSMAHRDEIYRRSIVSDYDARWNN